MKRKKMLEREEIFIPVELLSAALMHDDGRVADVKCAMVFWGSSLGGQSMVERKSRGDSLYT